MMTVFQKLGDVQFYDANVLFYYYYFRIFGYNNKVAGGSGGSVGSALQFASRLPLVIQQLPSLLIIAIRY